MIKRKTDSLNDDKFPLGKENYTLLVVGVVIIIIGFALMVGGGSDDPNVFNPEMFNFRRITLAPIVTLFGFVFIIYAIMKKPKDKDKK
jgi:membrane-bound ClpP family serine protease